MLVDGLSVGANLAQLMQSLAPVDVQRGAAVSLGYDQNGERDIVTYVENLRPAVFIPNHLTAVAVEGSSLEWKIGFLDALRARGDASNRWPEIDWLVDPNDYLRPIVFTPNSP